MIPTSVFPSTTRSRRHVNGNRKEAKGDADRGCATPTLFDLGDEKKKKGGERARIKRKENGKAASRANYQAPKQRDILFDR